jgi:hypothetical protein
MIHLKKEFGKLYEDILGQSTFNEISVNVPSYISSTWMLQQNKLERFSLVVIYSSRVNNGRSLPCEEQKYYLRPKTCPGKHSSLFYRRKK